MNTRKSILILLTLLIITSCQKSVPEEERLNQTFDFHYVHYSPNNSDNERDLNVSGTFIVSPNQIKVSVDEDIQLAKDVISVNKVTQKEETPNEYEYMTNAGDFTVVLKDGSIHEVWHYTASEMVAYRKKPWDN